VTTDTTPFRLDSQQVEDTFIDCVPEEEGGGIDPEEFDMIVQPVIIDKAKAREHGELILAMLMELPEQFRESGGGGWSFLNACDDRHGTQWTGLHQRMGQLFVLGQAIGMVRPLLPREMWDALPGGMPYYQILDKTGKPGG
jgi:hypothetical protein